MATTPAAKTTPKPAAAGAGPSKGSAADQLQYQVISALSHDQQTYAEGATVTLTAAQAAPLLGHTVVPLAEAGGAGE